MPTVRRKFIFFSIKTRSVHGQDPLVYLNANLLAARMSAELSPNQSPWAKAANLSVRGALHQSMLPRVDVSIICCRPMRKDSENGSCNCFYHDRHHYRQMGHRDNQRSCGGMAAACGSANETASAGLISFPPAWAFCQHRAYHFRADR